LFGKAPREVSGDRGIHSPENERQARALGVRRVSLPNPGFKTKRHQRRERQPWFRAARCISHRYKAFFCPFAKDLELTE
jgi:transposase, IS5 family